MRFTAAGSGGALPAGVGELRQLSSAWQGSSTGRPEGWSGAGGLQWFRPSPLGGRPAKTFTQNIGALGRGPHEGHEARVHKDTPF